MDAVPGTETELAADFKGGDTVLKIKDASEWEKGRIPVFKIDASGKLSDLPNLNTEYLTVKDIKVNADNQYDVTMSAPLKTSYPAGTTVRQHESGQWFHFTALNAPLTSDWQEFDFTFSGESASGTEAGKWRKGTKSAVSPPISIRASFRTASPNSKTCNWRKYNNETDLGLSGVFHGFGGFRDGVFRLARRRQRQQRHFAGPALQNPETRRRCDETRRHHDPASGRIPSGLGMELRRRRRGHHDPGGGSGQRGPARGHGRPGFNAGSPGGQPGNNTKWGVYLVAPENRTVRNVTAFLNGSGIGFSAGSSGCVIENCRSYANQSPLFGSSGNIIVLTPSEKTAIRNCLSFDSEIAGIRFYGGNPARHCIFEDNISFDNGYGDMWLKYPSDTTTARRCVAGQALYSRLIENCLFNYGDEGYFGAAKNSIIRPREKGFDETREFADPWNHDYRPQADSKYRDRAPAPFSDRVYYIKQDGNDRLDGNSVKNAWRTPGGNLKDGATFYLLPDSRQPGQALKNLKNVTIRGRGPFPVKLDGGISIGNCENITLERLEAASLKISGSRQVTVNQCAVAGSTGVADTAEYRLSHCVLNGVRFEGANGGPAFSSPDTLPRWNAYGGAAAIKNSRNILLLWLYLRFQNV